MRQIALFDSDLGLEKKLIKTFSPRPVIFGFHKFEQLLELIKMSTVDLILISADKKFKEIISLLKQIKSNLGLKFLPVVLYHPHPSEKLILEGLKSGADEFLAGSWQSKLFGAQIGALVLRSQRDLGVNPSTKLPGTNVIEIEIQRRLKKKERFAICYADLDNFKAYNDYYGYFYGDKLITLTSQILKDVINDLSPDNFIGHIGGDDFIFLIPLKKIDVVCQNIIKVFDQTIPSCYQKKDLVKGYIETKNRRGKMERFPLMTITISVLKNENGKFVHAGELSHMIADLKKYAKTLKGSKYVVERRRKY